MRANCRLTLLTREMCSGVAGGWGGGADGAEQEGRLGFTLDDDDGAAASTSSSAASAASASFDGDDRLTLSVDGSTQLALEWCTRPRTPERIAAAATLTAFFSALTSHPSGFKGVQVPHARDDQSPRSGTHSFRTHSERHPRRTFTHPVFFFTRTK